GSKEDILFEIMSGHIEALVEVAKRVGAIADPTERLTSLTHSFVHLYVGASARHKVLVNDLDKLPPERAAQIIKTERGLLDIIDGIIVETRPGLASEPSKRRALTMLYFGMINWMHTWYNPKGDQSPDRIADLVVHIFLDGLPKR
ncbi:MAG: TetR/AcrR family transcriptional regulator, partial [Proteobacteria bacterium]|nr:TetR/AcrR family transcriptional regulator [Pseudomonadota bacterium]